jgi:hypothetical protein
MMMHHATLCLALLLAPAPDSTQDAKGLAQEILTKGAALFDTRDAAAMAATYADNAVITVYTKDRDTGTYKVETTRGRAAIEKGYADLFKDRDPSTRSRNVVEDARFVGPELLLIHGTFTVDTNQGGSIRFVQVRVKQGDAWLILGLQLIVVSE